MRDLMRDASGQIVSNAILIAQVREAQARRRRMEAAKREAPKALPRSFQISSEAQVALHGRVINIVRNASTVPDANWHVRAYWLFKAECAFQDGSSDDPPYVSIARIITAVSETTGVSVLDLKSHRRSHHIVFARQICAYLARHFTSQSSPDIGRRLGRDHTTILHSVRQVEERVRRGDAKTLEVIKAAAGLLGVEAKSIDGRRSA